MSLGLHSNLYQKNSYSEFLVAIYGVLPGREILHMASSDTSQPTAEVEELNKMVR